MSLELGQISDLVDGRAIYLTVIIAIFSVLLWIHTEYMAIAFLILITVVVAWLVKILGLKWAGIETATFATVVTAAVTDTLTGAVAGFILITSQMAARQQFGVYILWVIPSYVIAGALTGYFQPSNIFQFGMGITVALHAVFMVLTGMKTPAALSNYVPYATINVGLNLVLFKFLASPLISVLA